MHGPTISIAPDDPIDQPGGHGLSEAVSNAAQHVSVPAVFPEEGPTAVGQRWHKYEILGLLGQGGMGVVYRAADCVLRRHIALKFLRDADPVLVQRFLQEARAQARISHECICRIYEVGEYAERVYIAMELVPGKPLSHASGELSPLEKVQVIRDAALGIHEAHRLGVIHRDLKPANIILEQRSDASLRPVIVDFGLARQADASQPLTQNGAVFGTPAYMAPEQARGERSAIDRRADVYSLGATLYELLCGAPPFQGEQPMSVLLRVLDEEPRPIRTVRPEVAVDLETITAKCLNKDPSRRYDSARELAGDLQRYLDGEPIRARPESLLYRLRRRAKRHRALVGIGLLSFVLILALLGSAAWSRRAIQRQSRLAERQSALAQQIGQDIRDMEWLIRSARQLPLHDLAREKALVRQRMLALEQSIRSYGENVRALALYALGRGHLALSEYQPALQYLNQAAAEGYLTAELEYARGLAMGKVHQEELYQLRLNGDSKWSAQKKQELHAKYIPSVLRSLQIAKKHSFDSEQYLQALIDFYQDNYDESLRKATAAFAATPWLYEAEKLAGDVYSEQAFAHKEHGRFAQAEAAWQQALVHYKTAGAIGRSDASVYLAAAAIGVQQAQLNFWRGGRGGVPQSSLPLVEQATADALIAEPGTPVAYLQRASAYHFVGRHHFVTGQDPQPFLNKAILAAQPIRKQGNPGAYYYSLIGTSWYIIGSFRSEHGMSPIEPFANAVSDLRQAIKMSPDSPMNYVDLATSHQFLAEYKFAHGGDPLPDLLKAEDNYGKAIELAPELFRAHANVIWTYATIISMGYKDRTISELLNKSEEHFERCIKSNPSYYNCYELLAHFYFKAANEAYKHAGQGGGFLERARALAAKSTQLNPNSHYMYFGLAQAYLVAAQDAFHRGADAKSALRMHREETQRCLKLAPREPACLVLAAQGELLEAERLHKERRSSGRALRAALAWAQQAVASNQENADAHGVLSAAYLLKARQELRGAAQARELARARAAAEQALKLNPRHEQARESLAALGPAKAATGWRGSR